MKRTAYTFFSLLMILQHAPCSAQSSKFEVVFGRKGYEYPRAVIQTLDKGYLVAGSSSSTTSGATDLHLLKVDSAGAWQWEAISGGINVDWGYDLIQTADSGYVIAGYTNSSGAGGYDVYLVRTDKNGIIQWTKNYGGTDWDFGFSIRSTSDGGFIIAGSTFSYGSGDEDMYLVRTNSSGDTLWTRTYGGVKEDRANSVIQTSDGGYLLAGYTNSFGNGNYDFYCIKTNPNGDTVWTRSIGGADDDQAQSCIQTQDGNFVFAGFTKSIGSGDYDYQISKLDAAGNHQWTVPLGGSADDKAYSVAALNNGNLGIAGYTKSFGKGTDNLLYITDAWGNYLGGGTFGESLEEIAYSIKATADNGFIIAAQTSSYGSGLTDTYLIKTDSAGKSSGTVVIDVNEKKISSPAFSVFPNPASDAVNIFVPVDAFMNSTLKLCIYNMTGEQVFKTSFMPGSVHTIDTHNFSAGIYLLQIISGTDQLASTRISVIK